MTKSGMTFLAAPLLAAALSFGSSAPAQEQNGLVNVAIGNVNVQVPISVAANVCGVSVAVLARDIGPGDVACEIDAETAAENRQLVRFAEQQGVDLGL